MGNTLAQTMETLSSINTISMPPPDEKTQAVIDNLHIDKKEIAQLWRRFTMYDKNQSGTIDVDEFYKMIHEHKNVFADSIFELIDIDESGGLSFGEFVQAVATYCVFGMDDILKFCFYIFDKDKNGFIEMDGTTEYITVLVKNNIKLLLT